jgi:DNA-directed RNA polymerase subunit RPC12/RpoP
MEKLKLKRPIKCQNCGHEWNTIAVGRYTNCPRCMYKVKNPHYLKPTFFVHFNAGEKGVKILDQSLKAPNSPSGRIIDIYFKDGKAWCEYDDSFKCKHIDYSLSLPIVQQIFKKKGWKIP